MKEHRESHRFAVRTRRENFSGQICCDFPQYNQYREGILNLIEYINWLETQLNLPDLSAKE